jgi:hypothetical protein
VTVSPKVYLPTLFLVLAGAALYALTGDEAFLYIAGAGLAGGGIGAAAPPAPGVGQHDVKRLAQRRRR